MNLAIHIGSTSQTKALFWILTTLRFILGIGLIVLLEIILSPGTPQGLLIVAIGIGIYLSSLLAFSRLRGVVFLLAIASLYAIFRAIVFLTTPLFSSDSSVLLPEMFLLHGNTVFLVFTISSLFTWLYWKTHHTVTFETLALLMICLSFLADHRNYNFSKAPRVVSDLAWQLGFDHLYTFVFLGVCFSVLALTYLALSHLPGTPRPLKSWGREPVLMSRPMILRSILVFVLYAALILTIARLIYIYHESAVQSLGSHGVSFMETGDESLGKSPLGFHSALGSNNQPAALVRLETDYPDNPYSPMLYLREGVLSKFDGKEIVSAGKEFNSDVPLTSPEERFEREKDYSLLRRTPVVHSVYTLANHSTAFAIDYPILLERVRNPAPERFRSAYKSYSLAPTHSEEELTIFSSGSSNWNEEKRAHYLESHTDLRYTQLASEITYGLYSDFEKARAITDYLSRESIYTLTPGHDVGSEGDPVASYLFGDMRGYCVHFAHAMTYMLRAIGIPARISTGYLTDMSEARDGHLLLRMSDRHAWAEAYIESHGWVVFDPQPETVESHADSDIDVNLLEELMGLVGPESDFLDDSLFDGETQLYDDDGFPFPLPPRELPILLLALILIVLITVKLYLRMGWRLGSNPHSRLELAYMRLASLLVDLGFQRNPGETRGEYAARVKCDLGLQIAKTVEGVNRHRYSNHTISDQYAFDALQADFATLAPLTFRQRLKACFNPASPLRFILRGRW